jgi:hypothetical protein
LIQKNWKELFESIGLLAVVFSLIFVAFQIRQDQQLTRSELGAGSTEFAAEISMVAIESAFQKTFVKMINEPDKLTDDEIVEIGFFLQAVKLLFIRECYLVERGVFVECDGTIRGNLRVYFQNEFAKAWWKQNDRPNPNLPDWLSGEIAELDANGNRRRLEELRESVQ